MNLLMQLSSIADVKTSSEFLEAFIKAKEPPLAAAVLNLKKKSPQSRSEILSTLPGWKGIPRLYLSLRKYSDKCRELSKKQYQRKLSQLQLMDMEEVLDRMEEAGIFPDENN